MRIAFFDKHKHDELSFNSVIKKTEGGDDIKMTYIINRLTVKTVRLAKGHDAICIFVNDTVDKDVIEKLVEYDVKLILLRCAGFNNIDNVALGHRIPVVRVPAYSPYAVAEHTFALLLSLNRRIHRAYGRTRDYDFRLKGLLGFDLNGKTMGLIGTGKIGQVTAGIAKGFGMKVLAYDPYPVNDIAKSIGYEYTTLDDLFAQSDIVSLHCPLTDSTKHIINAESISKMKDGVFVINTSRGALVDTKSLVDGLVSKKIGSAALDVYEEEEAYFFEDHSMENFIADETLSRLLGMNNVIVTAHQAFFTEEALGNIATTTIGNLLAFFNDGKLTNQVEF